MNAHRTEVQRTLAIGDSVMQGAGPDLYGTLPKAIPGVEVDAVPFRQVWHAVDVIIPYFEESPMPDTVLLHLGTNGMPTAGHLEEILNATRDAKIIVFNIRAPREWERETNVRLADAAQRHPDRVTLVDWWSLTAGRADWLQSDGFHLSRPGAAAYAHHAVAAMSRHEPIGGEKSSVPRRLHDRS